MKCEAFSASTSIQCVSNNGQQRGDGAAVSMWSQSVSIQLRRQVAETAGKMKGSGRKKGLSLFIAEHSVLLAVWHWVAWSSVTDLRNGTPLSSKVNENCTPGIVEPWRRKFLRNIGVRLPLTQCNNKKYLNPLIQLFKNFNIRTL